MLDWIFEGIANWVASIATDIMDALTGIFIAAIGTDMVTMEEYFPFAGHAFTILQYFGWALLFLITVWQLFRNFGGPLSDAEPPLPLLARSAIYAVLIGYAKPIFDILLNIARAPYTALMETSMGADDFTFAGVGNVLAAGLVQVVASVTIVPLLIELILLIALAWNYFKLMLETVERYIVVGVLCYTSPMAFSLGGSKATGQVFKSWCRMVGSQLVLLVLNVWFLRGFNSSVGHFVANGGALTSGHGNVFLWMFCALAFLKTAQKFDSYLASLGLNVAQTGSSMGMEMLLAARAISGIAGGPRSAGSVFRGSGAGAAAAGSAAGGGLAAMMKGNSYVRDAVVEGGQRIGMGGSVGFVGRMFGGMAARNGAELTGSSISSVAARPSQLAGKIGGDIADRSLSNYMPHLAGQNLSNSEITGGRISSTATMPDGKTANIDMFSAAQFEKPNGPHSTVTAEDGSQWYQVASGEGAAGLFNTPHFDGLATEGSMVQDTFPGVAEGTSLRTVEDGALEAQAPSGESSMWYNSGLYNEPEAPHGMMSDSSGNDWYTTQPFARPPEFDEAPGADAYNKAAFEGYMPGYDKPVSSVDASRANEGIIEVQHGDGSGMRFYDYAQYEPPRGDYTVFEDKNGDQWYAVPGKAGTERVPVFENGKPVYDETGENVVTRTVETVKYRSELRQFDKPSRRAPDDRPPTPRNKR